MVDLNQVRNQENSSEPLHLEVSNVGNPVDSLPTVPETPLSESLETPISRVKILSTLSLEFNLQIAECILLFNY